MKYIIFNAETAKIATTLNSWEFCNIHFKAQKYFSFDECYYDKYHNNLRFGYGSVPADSVPTVQS